ncbi:MAG: tetratricopeptide repeat protein [Alphaproteobacteria bacterium]|nr:tetratricopeptide repeat protein [Alphaproteobacteria bacterium]
MQSIRAVRGVMIAIGVAAGLVVLGGAGSGGGGSSGAATAPSGPGFDVAATYRSGVEALQRGDYATAVRDLRRVQRVANDDMSTNYALGLAYIGAGEPRRAVRPLERAAENADAPADARVQLGLTHLSLGDRAKAEEQRTALQSAAVACASGCTDARRAELEAAAVRLDRALTAEPTPAPTTGWLLPSEPAGRAAYAAGVALANARDYAAAHDAFREAESALGPNPDVLTYLGFTSRRLGRVDAALDFYRQALAIDPDHRGAIEYLGELYVQTGDLAAARAQLARLDTLCAYGCAEREELAGWIAAAR